VTDERNFIDSPFREVGTKFSLLDNKLYFSLATYRFEKSVFSDTVIGSSESAYESKGYEFEVVYRPVKGLTLMGSFGDQKSKYKNGFPFTTRPLTEEEVALNSGAIQYLGDSTRYANNPNKYRSGYPQFAANFFAIYEFENGFGVGAGPQYKSSFYNDNERTIKLPDALIWNANVFYRGKTWETFLRLNNITSEEYFIGSTFAPTMIVTKAEPFNWEVSVKYKF
jgi:outer membrane receptor for ferric coprogen and ferric-rhodotorulic acid